MTSWNHALIVFERLKAYVNIIIIDQIVMINIFLCEISKMKKTVYVGKIKYQQGKKCLLTLSSGVYGQIVMQFI